MQEWVWPTLGTAVCAAAACSLALAFDTSSFKTLLALLFLGFILLTATVFGNVAGMLGTILAAVIFAAFLFEPTFSLGVKDSAQRSNLIWMVVGGLAISELLGASPKNGQTRSKPT